MILGIGVDIVQVSRFNSWIDYSREQLLRIFSPEELENIFSENSEFIVQRMASRFAAKEACYKAFSAMLVKLKQTNKEISFLPTCEHISVKIVEFGIPKLNVNLKFFEQKLAIKLPEIEFNLSLSHEKEYAIAFVTINKKQ